MVSPVFSRPAQLCSYIQPPHAGLFCSFSQRLKSSTGRRRAAGEAEQTGGGCLSPGVYRGARQESRKLLRSEETEHPMKTFQLEDPGRYTWFLSGPRLERVHPPAPPSVTTDVDDVHPNSKGSNNTPLLVREEAGPRQRGLLVNPRGSRRLPHGAPVQGR